VSLTAGARLGPYEILGALGAGGVLNWTDELERPTPPKK
jgi:hypothetical protein